MSQGAIPLTSGGGGAAVRGYINNALARLQTRASGTARPSDIAAGEVWFETDNPGSGVWSLWRYDGSSDVLLGTLDTTNHVWTPVLGTPASGTLTNCSGLPGTGVVAAASSWTPIDASGAGLTFSSVSGTYQQIGNLVFASFRLTFPSTANGSGVTIGGLPVTSANSVLAAGPHILGVIGGAGGSIRVNANSTSFIIFNPSGTQLTNANLSTLTMFGTIYYPVS